MSDRRPEKPEQLWVMGCEHGQTLPHATHSDDHQIGVCSGMIGASPAEAVAFVRRGVESGEIEGWVLIERDRIRFCPFCGRLRERENPDDEMCLPTNCDAWTYTRRFNHETREWELVE